VRHEVRISAPKIAVVDRSEAEAIRDAAREVGQALD